MQVEKLSQTHKIGLVLMHNQITTSNFKISTGKEN